MKLSLKIVSVCLYLIYSSYLSAQVIESIPPHSTMWSLVASEAVSTETLYFDQIKVKVQDGIDTKNGQAPKFASCIATDIGPDRSGTWTSLPDGGRIWRVQISSPGALALIPCYDAFYLPDGATLHIYTPDRAEMIGAFTSAHNPTTGRYNTGLIHGDACIVEYYEPAAVRGLGRIHINEIGHAYRMVPQRKSGINPNFGQSGSCEVNVNCSEGSSWQDEKNAIVCILIKRGSSMVWCSGTLLNNTANDCQPYLLTADHCYQDDQGLQASAQDLSQWVFYFNYESPTCANPGGIGTLADHFMTGCTYIAASLDTGGNSGSDFALVLLNSSPPLSYHPYLAGWSIASAAPTQGVGIHHPNADIKKISTYNTTLTSTTVGSIPGTHWDIHWASTTNGDGVTEPGSSGSSLFDIHNHVVGTLTGGGSSCSAISAHDVYGKFSYSWASNGSVPAKRLKDWLDPTNSGARTLDGMFSTCPSGISDLSPYLSYVSAYPNPCRGILTLSNISAVNTISIIDELGRTIRTLKPMGQKSMTVDMSGEPNGIYLIRIESESGTQTRKLIIDK